MKKRKREQNHHSSELYEECYLVGMMLLRKYGHLKRLIRRQWCCYKEKHPELFVQRNGQCMRLAEHRKTVFSPLRQIKKLYRKGERKQEGKRVVWGIMVRVMNYFMPLAACFVLLLTINYFGGRTMALQVEYDGQKLGYIQDEMVFREAEKTVQERFVEGEDRQAFSLTPQFTLIAVSNDQLATSDELSDALIQASAQEIEPAGGLYVDGVFWGAVADDESLVDLLDGVLEPYRLEDPDARVTFANEVKVKQGLYPASSIISLQQMEGMVAGEGENDDKHEQLYLSVDFTGAQEHFARPRLDVAVTKTIKRVEEIPYTIRQIENEDYLKGFRAVSRQGENGAERVEYKVSYVNGIEVERKAVGSTLLFPPVDQIVSVGVGTLSYQDSSSPTFIWPVSRGYISAGLYGYAGHTGMDIAAAYGTPIRAAAAGRVVGVYYWNYSYGRHIIIDHGGGVRTLYAHNSSNIVSVGDFVSQGQIIGYVGSTGNSTGPHCHFEILINGQYVNPANFLGNIVGR